jgi:hypothetical protein
VNNTEEKFEEVFEHIYVVPSGIRTYIKKLMKNFDLYTAYLVDPLIAKTNNQLEEYYRQTEPQKVKKQYKTPEGLTHVLNVWLDSFPGKRSVFSHTGWVIQQSDPSKGNNSILGELAPEDLTTPAEPKSYKEVFII